MECKGTTLTELFADFEKIAKEKGMTVEEYTEWFKKNNPEIDMGIPLGSERFWDLENLK